MFHDRFLFVGLLIPSNTLCVLSDINDYLPVQQVPRLSSPQLQTAPVRFESERVKRAQTSEQARGAHARAGLEWRLEGLMS
jgi:hypothetical protein